MQVEDHCLDVGGANIDADQKRLATHASIRRHAEDSSKTDHGAP
jgi:hypothetical protein